MSSFKKIGRYGTVGFELILSMGLGFFAGQWLDKRYFGGKGYATLVGFVLGLAVGFRNLFRTAAFAAREADEEERRERTGEMEYQDEYLEIARKGRTSEPDRTERTSEPDRTERTSEPDHTDDERP